MRTAIIFSGHTRTFRLCWPTFEWHVGRHFADAKYFFSTVHDMDFIGHESDKCFPDGFIIDSTLLNQPEFKFDKPWTKGTFFSHEPYPISVPPENVMRQLWQLEQSYKLYLKTTDEKDLADIIIRVRPDLWFQSFHNAGGYNQPNQCHVPWWGSFGGVNDRFSIMGRDAADAYFFTFSKIPKLLAAGCPLHPESLVKASLEDEHVEIHQDMRCEFSTLRTDMTMRPPEISGVDIAHAALR